ncbi:hypothetical protein [Antarctobacter sp.]|uniref:hypothetical protein n=1 Tax=Antarctobacter sp. TaxID=1872577 RepID=UPI002B27350C|nr:hypothetical protein [Antarctobacter sp.]
MVLLFLTAFRVGLPAAKQGFGHARETLAVVLAYQLALPLLCVGTFALFGLAQSPVAIALTLMFAAPSVTGSPNMSVMLGHRPEPAFRLLILGTLILPLTIIPIFWLSPELGSLQAAIEAAARLGLSISAVVALAFAGRAFVRPDMSTTELQAVDGVTSLALVVIVVGLMSAVAPAISAEPWRLAGWMLVATGANFGMQLLAYAAQRFLGIGENAAPNALVAGNRNVALFLVASSATQSEEFLMFLGCYQFPMYLTPIIMRPVFQGPAQSC